MNQTTLILIIVIAIWLLALLISGLLAWRYQRHHQTYKKALSQFNDDFKTKYSSQIIKNWKLEPLKTKFVLPPNEELFYFDSQNDFFLYDKKTKEFKFVLKTEGEGGTLKSDLLQDREDLRILPLRNNFNLGLKRGPIPQFKADIYLTNQRLIFSNPKAKKTVILKIDEIIKLHRSLIYQNYDYYRGYVVQTATEIYEVISDNWDIIFTFQKLRHLSALTNKNIEASMKDDSEGEKDD